MVVLRATHKVMKLLPRTEADGDISDTALGDWYVNRIVVDRQPLLLFVSAKSRLAMLGPAREVKLLPIRFSDMVADFLGRFGMDQDLINAETAAMNTVRVGRTQDRSVLGQMVDFAKVIPYYLPIGDWNTLSLRQVEERLSEIPCRAGHAIHEVIFPKTTAMRLLREKWSSDDKSR